MAAERGLEEVIHRGLYASSPFDEPDGEAAQGVDQTGVAGLKMAPEFIADPTSRDAFYKSPTIELGVASTAPIHSAAPKGGLCGGIE
jgi:hypothetical protein